MQIRNFSRLFLYFENWTTDVVMNDKTCISECNDWTEISLSVGGFVLTFNMFIRNILVLSFVTCLLMCVRVCADNCACAFIFDLVCVWMCLLTARLCAFMLFVTDADDGGRWWWSEFIPREIRCSYAFCLIHVMPQATNYKRTQVSWWQLSRDSVEWKRHYPYALSKALRVT